MSSDGNFSIIMGQPASFYGVIRVQLRQLSRQMADLRAIEARRDYYDLIREYSGLPFEDYSDEPERWLAWIEANDTTDIHHAWKLRDERRRLRGLPPLPHY